MIRVVSREIFFNALLVVFLLNDNLTNFCVKRHSKEQLNDSVFEDMFFPAGSCLTQDGNLNILQRNLPKNIDFEYFIQNYIQSQAPFTYIEYLKRQKDISNRMESNFE
eukprot:GHVL01026376.1.p1 GENE.GHVL01026376.1~~GHVL01026376.1.p1  ORF type:complete len:108 (+),score=17.09 GHVL01026376.1:55-378(+)